MEGKGKSVMTKKRNTSGTSGSGSRLTNWRRRDASGAQFTQCTAGLLQAAVHYMAEAGGAIRFGKTRDGGAIAIGLYDGDEKRTEYLAPEDDLDVFLMDLLTVYAPREIVQEWIDWLETAKSAR